VNISKEEADRFRISKADLALVASLPTIFNVDKNDPALIWYQDI
jgi:hypothetical protein